MRIQHTPNVVESDVVGCCVCTSVAAQALLECEWTAQTIVRHSTVKTSFAVLHSMPRSPSASVEHSTKAPANYLQPHNSRGENRRAPRRSQKCQDVREV